MTTARPCHESPYVTVYDDVLSPADFAGLFGHINSLRYRSVHDAGWRKVWRLHDGNPLTSETSWYCADRPEKAVKGAFPTGTPLDALISWVVEKLPTIEPVVGKGGLDWQRLSIAPWIYPCGSGLSLHRDGDRYTGAFTYYAHPYWELHWGGHLIALDPRTSLPGQEKPELSPPFLNFHVESERAFNPGLGLTIFAKPNRIVFMAPDVQHVVTRVDVNAGQSARVSVAGFFHKNVK
jgi:hypothetical protein